MLYPNLHTLKDGPGKKGKGVGFVQKFGGFSILLLLLMIGRLRRERVSGNELSLLLLGVYSCVARALPN